jgi:hypothetical protein
VARPNIGNRSALREVRKAAQYAMTALVALVRELGI